MLFSPFIARRYFTARKKSSAVGIITGVSVTGVAVAVFAMFVVLSVFSGLRRLNVVQMGALTPDIKVYPARGKGIRCRQCFPRNARRYRICR